VVGLLLLAAAGAAHAYAAAAAAPRQLQQLQQQQPAGRSSNGSSSWGARLADQLLQRLQWAQQPFSAQRGTDAANAPPVQQQQQPDFSSTANALTTQAIQQADTRIAVLESQAALDFNTTAAGSDAPAALNASSGGDSQAEEPPQQQQAQPSARIAAPTAVSPLQLLLRSISRQWSGSQARQQQQQRGANMGPQAPDATQLWLGALDRLVADQPNLAAFARLVRNDTLLQVGGGWCSTGWWSRVPDTQPSLSMLSRRALPCT
jgi:hypothetical protein